MTSFLLLPGAGGDPWYWHLVVGELVRQGHQATAVDLPADDETADLDRYTDIAVAAAAGMEDIVVVAQSLGAFTAPLVANRLPVASVALVNPMIPLPGETPGDWWSRSGYDQAQGSSAADPDVFTHDLPPAVAATLAGRQRSQSATVFASPCRYDSWPAVPIHVLVGADDRFFPAAFQVGLCRARLGIEPVVMPGGHAIALSQPLEVARRLVCIGESAVVTRPRTRLGTAVPATKGLLQPENPPSTGEDSTP